MKCLSLFSGIGGFDLALTRKGHEIIAACEIDKYARTVYARHFPKVKIYEDATKIRPEELPDFELLCAGFPCQAFSIAGKRLGFEESRGTLFFEIARLARQKQPRLLLLENVKGLLSHDRGKTFAVILTTLDELGYNAEWQMLNSKYFVPQNRERIFIIGHLRGEPRSQVFPIGENLEGDNSSRHKAEEKRKYISQPLVREIDANYYKGYDTRTMIVEPKLNQLTYPKHSTHQLYGTDGIARAVKANTGSNTGLYTIPVQLANHNAQGRRMKTHNENTFTLDASAGQGIFNGQRVRRLTPIECERLQGFPDNYTEVLSDTQRYKCLGNAVTVPVIEYILERLE